VRSCGTNRSHLFVTSKIAAEAKSYATASKAIDDMLVGKGDMEKVTGIFSRIFMAATVPAMAYRTKNLEKIPVTFSRI